MSVPARLREKADMIRGRLPARSTCSSPTRVGNDGSNVVPVSFAKPVNHESGCAFAFVQPRAEFGKTICVIPG
jgi:hypothetical protein